MADPNPSEKTHVRRTVDFDGEVDDTLLTPVPADLSGFVLNNESETGDDSQAGAFIGRYQILRRLGRGGFGIVFLSRDTELDRLVAIKLPHLHRMQSDQFRQMYLLEARTLARLDHAAIVPIYDCGVIDDGRCFVVSKYIEGRDLSRMLSEGRIEPPEIARMLADVADALHHVHQAKIVHRDIKPANLLLGNDGRIYVADFGLALRDDPLLPQENSLAGTPNYMSPEQVRGEGHRVDGRSDQFSLGVVMYELLTGERPFSGGASHDVLFRILTQDPVPPRHLNRSVPIELNRICLKLLSKLASQRYEETGGLALDLRAWIRDSETVGVDGSDQAMVSATNTRPSQGLGNPPAQNMTVVPRGLRAFTRADAYFFLELLPGTRDRDGLPVSLGHWQRWVTSRDDIPDLQRVGVISGPTGCGKSSFIRAGLIPLLGNHVVSVVLEATPDLTERQLLAAIERQCATHLSESLAETLAAIRRGGGISPRKSLLIVLDQFEQWLHAHPEPVDSELVRAIRQCDGVRVQCIVLIRDDFWLALNRFMEAVEAPLQLGRNAMMIDLFDRRHARKVLVEFGRGYRQLPPAPEPLDRDQDRFIDGAIDALLVDGKIVPVHLALFAEMVKSKDWTPSTLRILGGTVGIGAQFLNESFSATYAPASQRAHEDATRSVLQALVPALGTEIKAARRSRAELLTLSGYESDRSRFDMLMTILESDLKLISATESIDRTRSESNPASTEQTTYQLSHDFLVPSIREWLTARQRESFRGRLHQRLTEQASLWSQQKESRFLPNFWEWLLVRSLLPRKNFSSLEMQMLWAKDRQAALAIAAVIAAALLLTFGIKRFQTRSRIVSLEEQLTTADAEQIPRIIDELSEYGSAAQASLESAVFESSDGSHARFVLQLAQLRWNPRAEEEVFHHVLKSLSPETAVIAGHELLPYANTVAPKCWHLIEANNAVEIGGLPMNDDVRFRAAILLTALDPPDETESTQRWNASSAAISNLLTLGCTKHPDSFRMLARTFQPVASFLIPQLSKSLGRKQEERNAGFAVSLLSSFTDADPTQRTQLCLDASDWQKELIVPDRSKLDIAVLWENVRATSSDGASDEDPGRVARRRAMAAALLLTLPEQATSEEIWSLLQRSSEDVRNTARSHLIRLMFLTNVSIDRLLTKLRAESDPGIQYALILAIGDYPVTSPAISSDVRTLVKSLYQRSPDAGVHSAAEWLMRRWGELEAIAALPAETSETAAVDPQAPRQWLRSPRLPTCDGHLMIHVDGRSDTRIGRNFLIAAHEVTVQQVGDFDPGQYYERKYSRTPDSPMCVVEWRMAAAYCNWLSRREGLPEFYPSDPESFVAQNEDYQKIGYRLPTEAEWEFASLAGAQASRFFGSDGDLLSRYGWTEENNYVYMESIGAPSIDPVTQAPIIVAKPVGLLRPNDLGLFDVYGNVAEWCNDVSPIAPGERAIRGGAAKGLSVYVDSRISGFAPPRIQYDSHGFRVARTLPAK